MMFRLLLEDTITVAMVEKPSRFPMVNVKLSLPASAGSLFGDDRIVFVAIEVAGTKTPENIARAAHAAVAKWNGILETIPSSKEQEWWISDLQESYGEVF